MVNIILQKIAKASPLLKLKLKQSGIDMKAEDFIKKTILSAFYITTGFVLFTFLVLAKLNMVKGVIFILPPIIFFIIASYLMRLPDIKISSKEKAISREIVFAGRFLVIELESGVSLYNALVNLSKNYEAIGLYLKEITNKADLGTSLEDALNEAAEFVPSNDFRRILWQVINSLRTGSDVSKSLSSVTDQIAKEQAIEVNKYGRKLMPLAMFYMMIAVILPTLGITMLIVLSSFIQFQVTIEILLLIAALIGVVQFMFIAATKFSRPPIEF